MGVKLWSLAIANMFVLVLTLLATVAASPLPSQDPLDPEISQTEDLAVEASNLQEIQSRVPAAVRLAILSAANAQPATVDRSPGYGKRSADDESEGAEDVTETEDLAVEASSLQSSERFQLPSDGPSSMQQMHSQLPWLGVQDMARDLLIARMRVRPSWVWWPMFPWMQ